MPIKYNLKLNYQPRYQRYFLPVRIDKYIKKGVETEKEILYDRKLLMLLGIDDEHEYPRIVSELMMDGITIRDFLVFCLEGLLRDDPDFSKFYIKMQDEMGGREKISKSKKENELKRMRFLRKLYDKEYLDEEERSSLFDFEYLNKENDNV